MHHDRNNLKSKLNFLQYLGAYSVFLSIIIVTLLIGISLLLEKIKATKTNFEGNVNEINKLISSKVSNTITLLESAGGTFTLKKYPSSNDFEEYSKLIKIEDNKSILGLGYVEKLNSVDPETLNKLQNERGIEKISVFPFIPRESYYPILYIQPENERNLVVLGYDMMTEDTRKVAMEIARDTGSVAVTNKVHLLQEIKEDVQPGILMYYPLYSSPSVNSIEERRTSLYGYVYVPIRVGDFIEKALADRTSDRNIEINIHTGSKISDSTKLFSYKKDQDTDIDNTRSVHFLHLIPQLETSRVISVGNNQWTIEYNDSTTLTNMDYYRDVLLVAYHGIITSILVLFLNITYMKVNSKLRASNAKVNELTDALSDSRQLKLDMLDSIQSGIIAINKEGSITHVNKTWKEYFKDAKDSEGNPIQWLGFDYLKYIYGNIPIDKTGNVQKFSEMLHRVLSDKSQNEKEIFIIEHDYSRYWVETTISTLKSKKGGVVINVADITRLKQLEKQKEDFLGVASHELKTPLTTIKAYAQMLKGKLENTEPTLFTYADRMNTQVDRLSFLISQLLEVSRMLNGKLILNKSVFDLCELANTIIDDYEILDSRKINLHYDIQCLVYADKERITQVITNLINNALKYSKDKDIDVYVIKNDNEIKLTVRDYGQGIDESLKDNLFERFFQATSPNSKNSGLGLGLFISKQIITGHGGSISYTSNKGDGTSFFFTLPEHIL